MKSTLFLTTIFAGSLFTFSACQQQNVTAPVGLPYQSSFQRDSDGWVAGITDYGTGWYHGI